MGDSGSGRKDIEARWKQRMENAKLRLDFAINYLKEIEDDRRAGRALATDLDFHRLAVRAETQAREEYERISRIYEDLVCQGKIPEDEEGPESLAAGG